jgi:hypothetical protein
VEEGEAVVVDTITIRRSRKRAETTVRGRGVGIESEKEIQGSRGGERRRFAVRDLRKFVDDDKMLFMMVDSRRAYIIWIL